MTKTILLLNYGIESVYEPSIGDNEVNFLYGFNEERVRMTESYNTMERQKTYVANCEFITESESGLVTEKSWTFLTCLTGVFAVVEKQGDTATLHYILKDNLGSWSVVTDKHGNIEQELSFDAWGNLRNPETWRTWSGMPEPMFDRGFTGHEHLYAFGLINMNGRMYDPQMSSFLSVDAYVQSPENAQGFNRYAYCLNNPLRYTDPTGWLPHGPMLGNSRHDDWGQSHVEPVYEPRDFGVEQLTDFEAIWMRGDELHGGGGDGCSNSGDGSGNGNYSTPDDPPGSGSANNNSKNKCINEFLTNMGEAGGGVATAVDGAASKATMETLSLTSKALGGVFVFISEIPDMIELYKDPSLGASVKLLVGIGLGVATVFGSPVVAMGAFTLGVVNAYGGFDMGYEKLNNLTR